MQKTINLQDAFLNQARREQRLNFRKEQILKAEEHWGVTHSVMAITAALMIWTGEIVSPMKTTAPKMASTGEPLRNAPVAPAPMRWMESC